MGVWVAIGGGLGALDTDYGETYWFFGYNCQSLAFLTSHTWIQPLRVLSHACWGGPRLGSRVGRE